MCRATSELRNSPMYVLLDASQDHLAQNARRRYSLVFFSVISGSDGDDELQCRDDKQPLTAFALCPPHALQPSGCPTLWLAERDVHNEPLIAIAANFIGADDGRDATRHPVGGNHHTLVHLAAMQHHHANARKIAHRHSRAGCRCAILRALAMMMHGGKVDERVVV